MDKQQIYGIQIRPNISAWCSVVTVTLRKTDWDATVGPEGQDACDTKRDLKHSLARHASETESGLHWGL